MKHLLKAFACLAIISIFSCKKDATESTPSVVGKWIYLKDEYKDSSSFPIITVDVDYDDNYSFDDFRTDGKVYSVIADAIRVYQRDTSNYYLLANNKIAISPNKEKRFMDTMEIKTLSNSSMIFHRIKGKERTTL